MGEQGMGGCRVSNAPLAGKEARRCLRRPHGFKIIRRLGNIPSIPGACGRFSRACAAKLKRAPSHPHLSSPLPPPLTPTSLDTHRVRGKAVDVVAWWVPGLAAGDVSVDIRVLQAPEEEGEGAPAVREHDLEARGELIERPAEDHGDDGQLGLRRHAHSPLHHEPDFGWEASVQGQALLANR